MKKIAWMLTIVMFLLSFAGFAAASDGVFETGRYGSFTGTVVGETQGDTRVVMLEDANGQRASFVIMTETYWMDGADVTDGGQVQIFYEILPFAPMIYPPQYIAAVVAPAMEDALVYVGCFDEDLVSLDNQLQLVNVEEAEVVDASGEVFEGNLAGPTLVVVYGPSTRSIPARTTPLRVVVIDKKETMDYGNGPI